MEVSPMLVSTIMVRKCCSESYAQKLVMADTYRRAGRSVEDIAQAVGVTKRTAKRYLKQLEALCE